MVYDDWVRNFLDSLVPKEAYKEETGCTHDDDDPGCFCHEETRIRKENES